MIEVEIDFRKSVQENAQEYFDEAKWAKEKSEAAKNALASTRRKSHTSKKKAEKPVDKTPRKRRRGKWYEKFRWMITTDGYLVVGGRDATQNEMLFKKHLDSDDLVLHADIVGAPLTIVKSKRVADPMQKVDHSLVLPGSEITPLAVREAGEFAAAYSSAWKMGLGSVDVYWSPADQVSKSPKSGEFLPKGAFVFHKRNFMKKMELKVAVGVIFLEDKEGVVYGKVVSGNVQSINFRSKCFVTIRPGGTTSGDLVKEIRRQLLVRSMPDEKLLIEDIAIEDFQRVLPAGGSMIIG